VGTSRVRDLSEKSERQETTAKEYRRAKTVKWRAKTMAWVARITEVSSKKGAKSS